MTRDRNSGLALIAGALGGIATMAVHPSGRPNVTALQADHLVMASALVHSFAILSCVALFLGTVGLTIRLQSGARQAMHLPFTALVVYGFSAVAVMIAGGLSGFVLPELMARMARDVVSTQQVYRLIISSLFQINQAFSRIYSVGGWLAILFWSIAAWGYRDLRRTLSVYGFIVSPLMIALLASGHVRLNIHGMGAVTVLQAIWFLGAGMDMMAEHTFDATKLHK